MLRTVTTVPELRGLRAAAAGPVAFVPTMGALHEGHLSLVELARRRVGAEGTVVASVFVNPAQFGPGEDFERYPRTLSEDRELLRGSCDVLFAPQTAEIYPQGTPGTTVRGGAAASILEGAHRPGHFDGMLTIVCKLLNIVQPDLAVFGEKDAQQLFLVRAMVRDLDLPVEIVGAPTVREADGLARSSRNAYLSGPERELAGALPRALAAAEQAAGAGAGAALRAAAEALAAAGLEPDYLELVDPDTFGPVPDGPAEGLLLLAVRLGSTRLIDNRRLRLGG